MKTQGQILEQRLSTPIELFLSFNVAELIGYCEAAFRALRELRLPVEVFQNVH